MTEPIDPIPPIAPAGAGPDGRRGDDRRQQDRRLTGRMMVPLEDTPDEKPRADAPGTTDPAGSTGFTAQMLGQGGEKRGLKGGPAVLSSARRTYLGAEYSGTSDRRPAAGKVKSKDA